MNYYHVFLGNIHVDLLQALSSEHAVQIVEQRFGSAKRYSKDNEYKAVRA